MKTNSSTEIIKGSSIACLVFIGLLLIAITIMIISK